MICLQTFRLINNLQFDIVRPVADMAAFFDYKLSEVSSNLLVIDVVGNNLKVYLQCDSQKVISADLGKLNDNSGEIIRRIKLAVIQLFSQFTGFEPKLPWGILTGVRPGKLTHKLLDNGVVVSQLPDFLKTNYLLPKEQGRLLTQIALKQKQLLSDKTRSNDAAVYIGIPYCPTRCSYCSFPAGIVPKDEESQQNFVNLIEQDLQNVVQLIGMHNLHIKSLYIGGGTPTSLDDKIFANLLKSVRRILLSADLDNFLDLQEFTVEAGRPDCFSVNKLAVMEAVGVNRISVNPQTFHDKTLRCIGRNHTVSDFYKAYEMVRKSSIPIVNMDLIIGLPQETAAEIKYSLHRAVQLAPDNLTVHTLTLKRSAPLFAMQNETLLSTEDAEELVQYGRVVAASISMEPYYLYRQHYMLGHLANIGYARTGTESIYNIQMMEERHPIIGVGPSSASKYPLSDGHHLRKLNMPKNVEVYKAKLKELSKKRAELFE